MSLFVAFGAKSTVDFREVPELVRAVQSQLLPGCADRPCVGEPRVTARDRLLSEMSGDLRGDSVAPACSEDELSTDADHRAILARRDLLMVVAMTGLLASCDGTSSPAGPKGRDAAPSPQDTAITITPSPIVLVPPAPDSACQTVDGADGDGGLPEACDAARSCVCVCII